MKCTIKRMTQTLLCVLILTTSVFGRELIPGGQIVGLELCDQRVVVAGFDEEQGKSAQAAGLKSGDIIQKIDDTVIASAEDIRTALKHSDGTVTLQISRDGQVQSLQIVPHITQDGPRLGVYLRQGIAGIGTVTFYDPETGLIGCLGHPICDRDTGEIFTISGGSLISARVAGVEKGRVGDPGELIGSDFGTLSLASLYENCEAGIFGVVDDPSVFGGETAITVAGEDDVVEGEAEILSCINGNSVQRYTVEIINVRDLDDGDLRDLEIRITDPGLLSVTGGIVQGMSGSPIIQNGKLIGAVTHVLVNDPTRGYGIFIENMLDAAE